MRATRPLQAALLGTLTALALTACGADDPEETGTSAADPTGTTSAGTPATSAPSPSSSTQPTGSASGDATDTPSSDCEAAAGTVPDGTWSGPITMDVDGRGGAEGFASTKGRGTMRVVVDDGKVTDGAWTVAWRSTGHADTGQAAATLRLRGRIGGAVQGPATKPVLDGTWSIKGQVHITKPVDQKAPVSETGKDTETLKVTAASCEEVTGTFLPSFNSKDAAATFTGKATWVGKPAG